MSSNINEDRTTPSGWLNISLEEIVDIRYGKGISIKELTEDGYPVFGANGKIGFYSKYTHADSEVLVTCRGATCGTVNISEPKSFVSSNSLVLRPRGKGIRRSYLKYVLMSTNLSSVISGTAQPQITLANFNPFSVQLPPTNEQNRIAEKIDALQAKSSKAKAALEAARPLLDDLRKSVLAAAFRGDLTADWREKNPDAEPAAALLKRIREERRMRWEEAELAKMRAQCKEPTNDKWKAKYKEPEPVDAEGLPELPEGWCWASADELTTMVSDGEHQTPPRSETGKYLLSARNIQDGYISYEKVDYIPEDVHDKLKNRLSITTGDVLMSCSGSLGRTCVVPNGCDFSMVRSVAILKPVLPIGGFMSYAIRSPHIQKQIDKKKTQTAQANIFQGKIKTIAFPLSSLNEQELIVKKVDQFFASIANIAELHKESEAKIDFLDQSVLAKAFRGELVDQDPTDEPASALLERIRSKREVEKPKKKVTRRKKKSTI